MQASQIFSVQFPSYHLPSHPTADTKNTITPAAAMAGPTPFSELYITPSAAQYTFHSPGAPSLTVARPSGAVGISEVQAPRQTDPTRIVGILGIIKLRLDSYIIIITKAQKVGHIRGHAVFKVLTTELLPMRTEPLRDREEDTYLALLREHLQTGLMYFSYTFDVTSSMQRQQEADQALPLWQRADERFFWNRYIQSDLINFRSTTPAVDPYILPVISGFLTITTSILASLHTPYTFVLITRRSRHRAGTRYFTRGADPAGNVANFNETEQLLLLHDNGSAGTPDPHLQLFSYVQTRGSIPLYWSELPVLSARSPKLRVHTPDPTPARLHLEDHIHRYGPTVALNLMRGKGREAPLHTAYEHALSTLLPNSSSPEPLPDLTYTHIDIHLASLRPSFPSSLLTTLTPILETHSYLHLSPSSPTPTTTTTTTTTTQRGIIRSNCLDCLDRTNLLQSLTAQHTMSLFLAATSTPPDPSLQTIFRTAWADNADAVSRAYAGTGALRSDYTRTGVRTNAGEAADVIKSAVRWARGRFVDGTKQDAFDVFLGGHVPGVDRVFGDRRPVVVQSVPWIGAACGVAITIGVWEGKWAWVTAWMMVGAWVLWTMREYGVMFVQWPRLRVEGWVVEGYKGGVEKVRGDRVLGRWIKEARKAGREWKERVE